MVMGLVVDFWGLIFWAGGGVFLQGVLRKTGCRTWFFAGEFVVE
jgi:di/tricarboxylate transporter